jgi:hypothetical protein
VARDDLGKVRIPSCQLGDALGQGFAGELQRHIHLTPRP